VSARIAKSLFRRGAWTQFRGRAYASNARKLAIDGVGTLTIISLWLPSPVDGVFDLRKVRRTLPAKRSLMLYYSLVFLIIAMLAGVLGFGVVAFAAAEVARICFFIFIVLFLVSLISHVSRSRLS
jgi:uncharacterized membrane protein YtjA (UPF0391 family)